jgi:hypothetical protein
VEPLNQGLLKSVQLEVQVLRLALLRGGAVELAAGVDEPAGGLGRDVVVGLGGALLGLGLEGIEQVAALVALVAAGVGVSAQAALALDETVGEELAVDGAVGLGSLALLDESVIPEPGKIGLARSGAPGAPIEGTHFVKMAWTISVPCLVGVRPKMSNEMSNES